MNEPSPSPYETNLQAPEPPPVAHEPKAPPLSLRAPQVLWPLCAVAVVCLLCLAAWLNAPVRFRLDPIPGVVRLYVETADGTMREVPGDAEGYFRLRPGTRRFSVTSGGLDVLSKVLTLKSDGSLYDGNRLFEFDRFAPRLVLDCGTTDAIPFVNGRRVESKHRTLRLPVGRYDILLLAGRDLSDVVSIELFGQQGPLRIQEFPWRFRDGSRTQREKAVSDFFETLYALDPLSWEIYVPDEKPELIDFFFRAFCRTTPISEQTEHDEDRENESFERRLVLLKDKIRQQLQNGIIHQDADGAPDTDGWLRLYRATLPWAEEAIGDWRYYRARTLTLRHTGQWNAAKEEIEKGLALAPGEATLRFEHGRILPHLGQFDEARKEIAEAVRIDPALKSTARIRLAEVDIRQVEHRKGEIDDETVEKLLQNALTLLNEAIAEGPGETEILFLRSLVFLGLGRQTDSNDDWREFETRMKPENRSLQIEKELERVHWKEIFQGRQEVPEQGEVP